MTTRKLKLCFIIIAAWSASLLCGKSFSMTQTTSNSNDSERLQKTLTPALFARHVSRGRWKMAPHLTYLDRALTDTIRTAGRLAITEPPRHGKSELCCKYLPAWYLGTFPDHRVMLIGYGAEFAAEWGRKSRDILEEHGHLFGVSVSKSSSSAERWAIEGRDGGMYATGVGGSLTGKGANLLIIDDPIKNSEEANSPTYRRKIHELYQSAAYTRLEPNASVIVIQTRWHEDDLAGRLLRETDAEDGEHWRHVCLPAIAGENDQLGRKPGEALWPERFDLARLAKIRRAIGSYFWSALYQQTPVDEGRNQIKPAWLRYWSSRGLSVGPSACYFDLHGPDGDITDRIVEADMRRAITIDCAASSDDIRQERRGRAPSNSVISFWLYHRDSGRLIWRDCWAGMWGFPELQAKARKAYQEFQPDWMGAEWEKTGIALLQSLADLSTRRLKHENKGKLERFARAANMLEQGKVYLPQDLPCRYEIEDELLKWDGHPESRFDRGDTLAYAALELADTSSDDDGVMESLLGGKIATRGFSLGRW